MLDNRQTAIVASVFENKKGSMTITLMPNICKPRTYISKAEKVLLLQLNACFAVSEITEHRTITFAS